MSNGLTINTSVDKDHQLQFLLQRQAEINAQNADLQAQISALQQQSQISSSAPSPSYLQHHRSPINKNHFQRSINVPRSMSNAGPAMARQLSDQAPSQRSRALSQRSVPAPSMVRKNSRGSSSARSGNTPFIQHGNTMPRPFRPEQPRDNTSMDTWMDNCTYNLTHQPQVLQRSVSQRQELPQVPELDLGSLGENPNDYISRIIGTPTLAVSPPFSTPSSATIGSHHVNNSFNIATPSTPTTDSLTTGTTLASMSRTNSLCNDRGLESFPMMHLNSSTSYSSDVNADQFLFDHASLKSVNHCNRYSSSEEQNQILLGAGGVSHDSQFSHSFSSADNFPSVCFGEKMEKSQSNESTSSTSSSASRSKQRLQIAIAAAEARPLQPKGGSAETIMSRENSSRSMRVESKSGLENKMALHAKPSYQRPKHDRVFCKQCESHPEGFRGEHELRRHQDREHKSMVKKWVCIEPSGNGHPKPELALSKCKACFQQKKKYGAYYNAAAHLRRAHFKPKAKGRSKNNKVDDSEKRGGKGGGDWPPMSELKHWMKEVEEAAPDFSETQEDEAAESDEDETLEGQFDDYSTPSQTLSNNSNFESYPYMSDLSIPTSTNSDIFNDMSIDLSPHDSTVGTSSPVYAQSQFQQFPMTNANLIPNFGNDASMVLNNFFEHPIPQGYDDAVYSSFSSSSF